MAFDIIGAKNAGYSDTEIADYLAQQTGFDAAGARKAGYSDQEIIGHVSGSVDVGANEKPKSSLLRRAVGDTAISALKGAIGLPESVVGLADIVTGGMAGQAAEKVGYRPKEAKAILDTMYSPEQQEANAAVQSAEGFVPTIKAAVENPSTIFHSAVESAPSMIGGAGIARGGMKILPKLAPVVAGALGEGAISAGQTAEQVRQEDPEGRLSLKQSALAAGSGALTGAISLVGGRVAQKLGITDIDTFLASGAAPQAKAGLVKSVAEGLVSEGFEESAQSAQEQIAQNVAQGKPWSEGVGNATAMGGITGGVMGGGGNVIGHGAPAVQPAPAGPLSRAVSRAAAPVQGIGSLVAERRGMAAPAAQPAESQPQPATVTLTQEPFVPHGAAPVASISDMVGASRDRAATIPANDGIAPVQPPAVATEAPAVNPVEAPTPTQGATNETADEVRQDERQYANGQEVNANGETAQGDAAAVVQAAGNGEDAQGDEGGVAQAGAQAPATYYRGRTGDTAGHRSAGAIWYTPDREYAAQYGEVTEHQLEPKKTYHLGSEDSYSIFTDDPAERKNLAEMGISHFPADVVAKLQDMGYDSVSVEKEAGVPHGYTNGASLVMLPEKETATPPQETANEAPPAPEVVPPIQPPTAADEGPSRGILQTLAKPKKKSDASIASLAAQHGKDAVNRMVTSGYIAFPGRGMAELTKKGRAWLEKNPAPLSPLETTQLANLAKNKKRSEKQEAKFQELSARRGKVATALPNAKFSLDSGDASTSSIKPTLDANSTSTEKMRGIVESPTFLDELDKLVHVPTDTPMLTHPADGVSVESSAVKGHSEGMPSDIQFLSGLLRSKPFLEKGYGGLNIETQGAVNAAMLRIAENPQVLKTVVKFIPVDVMDMLRREKLTPEMVFHDPTVLKHTLSANLFHEVPTVVDRATTLVKTLTLAGAVVDSRGVPSATGSPTGRPLHSFPTHDAKDSNKGEPFTSGGTGPRAKEVATAVGGDTGRGSKNGNPTGSTVKGNFHGGNIPRHGKGVNAFNTSESGSVPLTLERVQDAFPKQKIAEKDGAFIVTTPSGVTVRISKVGTIEFDRVAAESAYGRKIAPDEYPVAEFRALPDGAIINLTEKGISELPHEVFHFAMATALTPKQIKAVLDRFGTEENAAAEYQRLKDTGAFEEKKGHLFLNAIYRFFRNLRQLIAPTAKGVMQDVASGKVWEKAKQGESGTRYAANGGQSIRDRLLDRLYEGKPEKFMTRIDGERYLAGKDKKGRGIFLVVGVMDRSIFKTIMAESATHSLQGRPTIFVERATYQGDGINIRRFDEFAGTDEILNSGKDTAKYALSRADQTMTDEQKAAVEAAFGKPKTLKERAKEFRKDLRKNLEQGIFDQYAPIKDLDMGAYMKARMTKGGDSTLEAVMLYGKPYIDSTGSIKVDFSEKNNGQNGFASILAELDGEHDRFLKWVAGIRAGRLKDIGLENLMSKETIAALKTLNRDGTAQNKLPNGEDRAITYMRVLNHMNAYNDAILKVAVERGLINDATRQMYKDMPYIPFYRLQDEGVVSGFTATAGLVNQTAWKKLKGGTNKLNDDMLANMLKNWSHLITASARNEAAAKTLTKAVEIGAAHEVPAGYPGKGIVSFRENTTTVLRKAPDGTYKRVQGEPLPQGTKYKEGGVDKVSDGTMVPEFNVERHFIVTDSHLLDAITSIGPATKAPKVLRGFKNVLTHAVTINPTFKIRNLIRDSVSSVALADMSYNPVKNVKKGFALTAHGSETRAQMMAAGGIMRFGSMLDGASADNARKLIDKGVPAEHILDSPNKVAAVWKKYVVGAFDAYQEFGDRSEQVNRAALYQTLLEKGYTADEAAFWARDLMDFSMSGKWAAVRFLTQTVPFMNARLQGLYKLGRAAKADRKRFAYVIGGVALSSLALLAAYHDDDDWKKREAWDRDNYWWFKVGDKAFRIPKPFEIGAIGSIAEWSAELMFNDEMTGGKFAQRMRDIVSSQLSLNPTPQLVKPLIDLWANKDSFTNRPIETMGMDRLKPEDRYSDYTSGAAKVLGKLGLPNPAQVFMGRYEPLSPVQIDSLVRGYFSWLGVMATTALDYGVFKPLSGIASPTPKLKDVFMVGNFVEGLPSNSSRYVSEMYEQSKEIEQSYNSYRAAVKAGDTERAAKIMESDKDNIKKHMQTARIQEQVAELNRRIKQVTSSRFLSGDQKREKIDALRQKQDAIARRMAR